MTAFAMRPARKRGGGSRGTAATHAGASSGEALQRGAAGRPAPRPAPRAPRPAPRYGMVAPPLVTGRPVSVGIGSAARSSTSSGRTSFGWIRPERISSTQWQATR